MERQYSSEPLVSIITINRNNAEGLRKTLESVRCQTSQNYEHIIIDGESTDSSVDVIKEFLADESYKNHVTYWHSQKDSGVYDAMNKGVPHARGKYCLFLNSGDFFYDAQVMSKVERLCAESDADIFYGKCFSFTKDYEIIKDYPRTLSLGYLYGASINHQNCLVRASIQKEHPFSMEYKILSDREFFINALLTHNNLRCQYIDFIIARYEEENGLSSSNPEKLAEEEKRLRETAFPKIFADSFRFFDERIRLEQEKLRVAQDNLDSYEKKYHGILKSMLGVLKKYSALKSKFR